MAALWIITQFGDIYVIEPKFLQIAVENWRIQMIQLIKIILCLVFFCGLKNFRWKVSWASYKMLI